MMADPRMIEHALGRRSPFGHTLQSKVRAVPLMKLRLVPVDSCGNVSVQLEGNRQQGMVHLVAYAAPQGELLMHRRFPVERPLEGLMLKITGRGLAVHLIHEDVLGLDELQVLGDVRVTREPEPVEPVERPKQKRPRVARGHEASLALAKSRQVATVQTMNQAVTFQGRPSVPQQAPPVPGPRSESTCL